MVKIYQVKKWPNESILDKLKISKSNILKLLQDNKMLSEAEIFKENYKLITKNFEFLLWSIYSENTNNLIVNKIQIKEVRDFINELQFLSTENLETKKHLEILNKEITEDKNFKYNTSRITTIFASLTSLSVALSLTNNDYSVLLKIFTILFITLGVNINNHYYQKLLEEKKQKYNFNGKYSFIKNMNLIWKLSKYEGTLEILINEKRELENFKKLITSCLYTNNNLTHYKLLLIATKENLKKPQNK